MALFLSPVLTAGLAEGTEINFTDPAYQRVNSNAMDQPRLYAVLTDDDGEVILDSEGNEVVFRAFVDTGSSGFVISNLHAGETEFTQSFGFDEDNDYIGEYTNLGLGGEETGWVTREFGIRMRNQPDPLFGEADIDDFIDYGQHRLWVRQQPGVGEVVEIEGLTFPLVSPVNIIGMPVIGQRAMVMEWVIPEGFEEEDLPPGAKALETRLLEPGDPAIPATNIILDLEMRNFVEAEEDEILPGVAKNPLVTDVTISHDPERDSVTADWLFDTGAGSSFISFEFAQTIGLIPESYDVLQTFVEDHQGAGGMTSQVGGIGPDVITVPMLEVNEIRVPARNDKEVVWENVLIMVFDHPELAELGLEGIFGMNLVGPAATIDSALLEDLFDWEEGETGELNQGLLDLVMMMLSDISPSPVNAMVFEVTGTDTAELRFASDLHSLSFDNWAATEFPDDEPADLENPEADPGNFGIPLLLRYAFGMDAKAPERELLPRIVSIESGSGTAATIEHYRRGSAPDVSFILETSTDLSDWHPIEAEWEVVTTEGDREKVRTTLPVPSDANWFFRIRVE